MQPHRETASRQTARLGCWQPPVDTVEVFRAMIDAELRAGRLSARARARIVRYAAQMGLSAVEAGRLFADCQAAMPTLPKSETPALRYIPALPRRALVPAHVAITTGVLLLIIWMMR